METPVPRMTRSRARGIATPSTSLPGRKTAVTVKAGSRTATKAAKELQAEPSNDLLPTSDPDQQLEVGPSDATEQMDSAPEQTTPALGAEESSMTVASEGPEADLASLMSLQAPKSPSSLAPLPMTDLATPEPTDSEPPVESDVIAATASFGAQGLLRAASTAADEPPAELSITAGDELHAETVELNPTAASIAADDELPTGDVSEPEAEEEAAMQAEEEEEATMQPEAEEEATMQPEAEEEATMQPETEEEDEEEITEMEVSASFPAAPPEEEAEVPASDATFTPEPATVIEQTTPETMEETEMVASSPVATKAPTAQYVSKTPGPTAATRTVPAKQSLTTVKPGATAPALSPLPATRTGGRDQAVASLGVRFQTPVKDATPAGRTTKGALKPSSTFGTPGPASKKTSEGTAKAKRVSISTPVHPKSASQPRHIVRTPFPRKALPEDDMDQDVCLDDQTAADDLTDTEAAAITPGTKATPGAKAIPLAALTPVAIASLTPAGDKNTPGLVMGDDDDAMDEDVDMNDEEEGSDVEVVEGPSPATRTVGFQAHADMDMAPAPRRLSPTPSPMAAVRKPVVTPAAGPARTTPTLNSTKRVQAHSALHSLARAEAAAVQPPVRHTTATLATYAGHTPASGGASAGANVPSYMAPTANALRKSKLKSVVVVPEDFDNTSLGQVRRQIKEAAARKTAAAPVKPVVKMNEVRRPRLVDKAMRDDSPEPREAPEDDEATYDPAAEAMLIASMTQMAIAPPAAGRIAPLKGMPVPQGKHTRFVGSKGKAKESPTNTRPLLRGVVPAQGTHLRFKD